MISALILVPAMAGLLAFLVRDNRLRRALLLCAATAHFGLTVWAWISEPPPVLGGWLFLDAPGRLFLGITSLLFLAVALYTVGYLDREGNINHRDFQERTEFLNAPEKVFTGSLLFFLSTMTLVTTSQHFGLLWVAIEATTLASAPLIYFHRQRRSLEATWKYLLICSVGIALALLGTFFLAVAATNSGAETSLQLSDLTREAASFNIPWFHAAFIFLLVGYGAKMGLAPLHTWLPDAHSEAPSVISALLSGALLNCAFLGILRAHQVCVAGGQALFSQELLLVFGLMSMAVAAVFIMGQPDYKRMLAYSSVEHMGILALGVGLGGNGVFGSLLHAVSHSLTKAMLFLVAGNILAAYGSKMVAEVSGLAKRLPISGFIWLAGFMAIVGLPPFGLFLSEFAILKAGLEQGAIPMMILYLTLLSFVFIGMVTAALRMTQGVPDNEANGIISPEPKSSVIAPIILFSLVLLLGLHIPSFLNDVLQAAALAIGG